SQGYHLDRYQLPGGISNAEIQSVGLTGVNSGRTYYATTSDAHFDLTPHALFQAGAGTIDVSLFTSARKSINNFVAVTSGFANNVELESYEFQPKVIATTPLTDRLDNKLTAGYDYIDYREKRRVNFPGSLEDVVFPTEASQGVYLLNELT